MVAGNGLQMYDTSCSYQAALDLKRMSSGGGMTGVTGPMTSSAVGESSQKRKEKGNLLSETVSANRLTVNFEQLFSPLMAHIQLTPQPIPASKTHS